MEATVLVCEIGGLGQVCWSMGPGEVADALDSVFSTMTRTSAQEGGLLAHRGPMGTSFCFHGEGHSSRALGAAIRLIDLFRSGSGDFAGLSLKIGLDSGEITCPGFPQTGEGMAPNFCDGEIDFEINQDLSSREPLTPAAGVPFFVASDLAAKTRANTVFLTERVKDLAGEGFCFDEANRARLRDYPTPMVSMVLCGRCRV